MVRVVRSLPANSESGEIAVGDISDTTDWIPALATYPEVVVHLAARVPATSRLANESLPEFRRINVGGTLNLATQAAMAGVKRFVFVSSAKVNGDLSELERPFRVGDDPDPQDAYAMSKNEAEMALRSLACLNDIEVVIVRPPLVYGPGVKGNFASLLEWLRSGLPLPFGRINNKRSLIALENLVDFIVLCADRKKSLAAANETFLVSDLMDVSTAELMTKVARAYGCAPLLIPVPPSLLKCVARITGRSAAMDRLLGSLTVDSSKAVEMLGWSPVVTMEEQLAMMARHDATHS